ncbi:MAG: GNAT family N-acetyltransferase [Saprospiraceae bacterium]|nr:GNAT family N-acetyltransferase [Saprospiraceae bacterium]
MHSSQDKYRQFAKEAPDLPLFMQDWYLDAVCTGGDWDAAILERNERIVAVMPYFLKKKWLGTYVAMPQLCKFMGPYLLPEFRNLDDENKIYEALLTQLPSDLRAFEQDLNYQVTNWLPFYWSGFRQTTRYSYVLDLTRGEEPLFDNIQKNYKQKIRSAQGRLQVQHGVQPSELLRLINLSFARQGLRAPLDALFFQRYLSALQAHDACRLFFAIDPTNGAIHSASLLAWDNQSAYYVMSGDDPVLRNSGSALLLKWEAIRYAANELRLPVFDFEGSMIRAIEIGRRDFGAVQKPYFRVQKEWSLWWKLGKFLNTEIRKSRIF